MDFGYHHMTFQYADDPDRSLIDATVGRAQWLDDAGFSFFSLMDHVWQLAGNGRRDEPFLDCYTTLPAIAQATDDIEVSALVTCVHYRNPALLGRMLTTLDRVSHGRAVLGIGAGWYEAEYDAMGIEYPDPATRVRQLRDAIELIKTMWTEASPASYEGRYYDLDEFTLEPKPVREPHPPILVGGGGEQLTLRVTAEHADRWNIPGGSPEHYEGKLDVLGDHCEEMGRDYDAITKTVANTTVLREDTESAHEAYETLESETETGPTPREEDRGAVGTPAEVCDRLESFADVGVDTFVLKVPQNDRRTVELFVDEVLPQFD